MRLQISKSKNAASLYVVKSTYINKVHSTKIVEKLGTYDALKEKLNGRDPIEWANEYIKELNRLEKEGKEPVVMAKYLPSKLIEKNVQRSFNGGYLFLQQIYHQLGIHTICNEIANRHKFTFNLDSILSRLLYGRILFPGSKRSTHEDSLKFIEQPDFDLKHIYRALGVIAEETDYIQSELYKNSVKLSKRNTGILFYDCTNFFFEIEQEAGLKQYGYSKEHRPNPIVQMGLFMDGDGIPLAFSIHKGNTNEQITLKPLEQKILDDFALSKFVVCTDAGLASTSNRRFNSKQNRAFITTQPIKKLKAHLKTWAIDPTGWKLSDDDTIYDISKIESEAKKSNEKDKYKGKVFYKERWIKEENFEQKLVVTYSIKYRDYQRKIRNSQIERAQKTIISNPKKLKKHGQNDYKRFILKTSFTKDGKAITKESYTLDTNLIEKEASFDGFYAVCTNLEDDGTEIAKINQRRWEIEECFRIMKSEFKARPVYLRRDDCIQAHFTTCFMALMLYRLLEKKLDEKFTCSQILSELKDMNFYEVKGDGYIPTYTRTDFTDALHEAFGFHTDYEIVTNKQMKKNLKKTKS